MLLGGYVSANGGLHKAIEKADRFGFEVAMFFIGSPHTWWLPQLTEEEVSRYTQTLTDSSVQKTYAHGLYLANLASPDPKIYKNSIRSLTITMQNGEKVGIEGVIFHLGSHRGTSVQAGLERVIDGMQEILDKSPGKTKLIMENSVQQKDKVGTNLAELGHVLNQLNSPRVSVCYDTCHGFAMNYNYADPTSFETLLSDINLHIGLDRLDCMHINDSQTELGSHIDRHANLGKGYIGLKGFEQIVNEPSFQDLDFILEVPGQDNHGPTQSDLQLFKSLIK